MKIPMVDLKEELKVVGDSIKRSVMEVIDSGSYILGEKGRYFEQQVANYLGANFAAGVANGTDALLLALEALDIGPGDQVITTPFTFFATAEMIARVGAIPVFVDIEPETYNMDPQKIEAVITEKTKAIIVVHLFGKAIDMYSIKEIAAKYNLKIIEDAAQGIGTVYNGEKVGQIGDIGSFSLFPSKNLGAFGDAGIVVTNNVEMYEKVCQLRNHGSKERYIHSYIGVNSRLDEIQAAILIEKLKLLDTFLDRRREIANNYTIEVSNIVKTPPIIHDRTHTFHQYCIQTEKRDELSKFLNKMGIASAIYYPIPLHLQKAFQYLNYQKGDFPISEKVANEILALPIFPMMSEFQQEYIISAIKEFEGVTK
ncbi:DegT/DnrJ/EryC1/StrS family aminotransferase [Fredinandcohnia sp. 179-A 10B2 NHS]|uniref:DegT/DnrJ/EryC1/StrS family aminotransferase n=1 Tax=Fredinandcohnia sp. 179-A 10B2 NHS TaxID=3235176 RepID=UPI0039A2CDA5